MKTFHDKSAGRERNLVIIDDENPETNVFEVTDEFYGSEEPTGFELAQRPRELAVARHPAHLIAGSDDRMVGPFRSERA